MKFDLATKINIGTSVIVFCILAFAINEYNSELDRLGQDQVRQFQEVKANLRSESELVTKYIAISRDYAENYFRFSKEKRSPWLKYLKYDSRHRGSYLDGVSEEYKKRKLGNVTIVSDDYLKNPQKMTEISMALELGEHFSPGLQSIKSSPWFYYTSSDFMYLAPYLGPNDFFFSKDLLTEKEFYRKALPENNPERKGFWTSVYLDAAGLGLMITYSQPVYEGDQFKGAISMDVTVDQFNSMVRRPDSSLGTYILFNRQGQVIADPSAVGSADATVTKVDHIIPSPLLESIRELQNVPKKQFFRRGAYFAIYEDFPELDSNLLFMVPVGQFITSVLHSTLMLFLVSIFCIFLVLKLRRTFIHEYEMQQNLVQNSKMSALGQMASGMAHEINNPLAIITGKAMALKRLLDTNQEMVREKISGDLSTIINTANRIAKIIRSLRAFSRNGEQDPFSETHLPTWISEVLELCYRTIDSHAITLKVREIPDVKFEARESQLSQVLLNLLNNSIDAIKGTENREIELSFDVKNDKVLIYVRDSGAIIPAEVQARLMEPFFTTKPIGVGTGLGLSISLGIMKSHQGNLRLVTEDSRTCFEMEIPIKQQIKT